MEVFVVHKSIIILSIVTASLLTGCGGFHSHDWVAATCTTSRTCTICGYKDGDPLGHEFSAATCTTPATCIRCGSSNGDALGHDYSKPTCTQPATCSRCGATTGDTIAHTVPNGTITVEPTCTEVGSMTGTCSQCGAIVTVSVDKTEHKLIEGEITLAPTCSEDGQRMDVCQICGETFPTKIPYLGHTAGEWEIETPATYYSSGIRIQKCSVCQHIMVREQYKLSGSEKEDAYKNDCLSYTYKELARTPDNYIGDDITFTGEVIQVYQKGENNILRINVTRTSYGYTDTIYVTYKPKSGESRILEDDVVTVWGPFTGIESYTSILGQTISIPSMEAWYLTIK